MNVIDNFILTLAKNNKAVKGALSKDREQELFVKLQKQMKYLFRVEVKKWRNAHQQALDHERPMRVELLEVFEEALLDPHLRTVIQTRILNVLNLPVEIYDLDTGEVDEDATRLFEHKWFYDATYEILMAIQFGYSCLKFVFKDGQQLSYEVSRIESFPREHVVPEWKAIRPDANGDETIPINKPPFNRFYVIVDTGGFGLLLPGSRFTISKKNAINQWSRYQELFGIPPRTATTTSRDDAVWDKLEHQLKEMGKSMSAVLPEGTEFKVHETTSADPYNIFLQAARYADEQLSKLVLGQTMTTDDGSSRSQSEVHERVGENYTKADVRMAEHVWMDQIFPILISWGYPIEGKGLRYNMSSKLKLADSQLAIDQWISQSFEIDDGYIEETYGTPISNRKESEPVPPPEKEKK